MDEVISSLAPDDPLINQMRLLCTGAWVTQAVAVAAELGLADLLADGPQSAEALAQATSTNLDALTRLLRLLVAHHIFVMEDDRFALAPLGQTLRSNIPGAIRDYVIMMGRPWSHEACAEMLWSVQTGQAAWQRTGQTVYSRLHRQPEDSAQFSRAMANWFGPVHQATAAVYDCSTCATIVDLGGGYGSLLTAFLTRYSHLRGVLFDLPPVIEQAMVLLAATGMAERITCISGNYFEAVPGGGELYLLSFVIHNWDDDPACQILARCHSGMPAHARLLIIEMTLPTVPERPSIGLTLDINMLVHCAGRERTIEEYQALLARSGFRFMQVLPITADFIAVEAMPVFG